MEIFAILIAIIFAIYLGTLIWSVKTPKDNNPWKLIRTDILPSGFQQMSNNRHNYELSIKQVPMEFYQKKIVYVWKNTLTGEIKTEQVSLFDNR